MAGHSKWSNIKHRKAAQDAKRGKIFTKLIREIVISARLGGDDQSSNPRLRAAVQSALSQNMTRDTVDRAIKRGAGGEEGANVKEYRFEGYGPCGVAVMVDCMSDNNNRTVSEVRHAFTKHNGNLGTDGSVAYLFSKQGIILVEAAEDDIMEVALENGADDIYSLDDNLVEVVTDASAFSDCLDTIKESGFNVVSANIDQVASTKVDLDDDGAQKVANLIDRLEDLDDVQTVYTNAVFPSE